MKTVKKVISLVLAVIMCLSIVPMMDMGIEASAAESTTFSAMKERAEAIINYKWTPSKNITTWNNNTYNGLPYFKKGETVTGMPYTLFTTEVVSYSLLSLSQYKSKASSNYSATAYCVSTGSNRTGPVYGSCCADFVCEVFGGKFMSGSNMRYHNVQGIQKSSYGTTTKNVKLSAVEEGDALSNTEGTHIVWVGEVTDSYLVIYEQTPPVAKKTKVYKSSAKNSNGYLVYGGSVYNIVTKSKEFTADEVFEEHPFKGTMKVTSTSKTIKALPYSSSNTVKTIVTDSEIDVVAYVYNKYGNLWYKTSSGNYIHSNYLEVVENDSLPPSNYLNAQFKVVCSEKSVKNEPLASSETIRTIKKDEIINVIGYLYNEYDNLWYILEDGGYVPHHYFSVISSNIRTPSNYFNENLIARAGKPIRSAPYSSAEEIGRTVKNDYVNIDGYLYNRYGNLWYMTNDGYFVLFSYLEQSDKDSQAPSNYVEQKFIADANKAEKYDPYNVSASNRTISKGSTISTIGYVINLYGNKWLYNNNGYYIYPSNLTCVHSYTSSITKNATCTATGVKTYKCTCGASYTEAIAKKAHTEVIDKAVAATCTKTGLTEGKHCSVCGTVIVAQKTIAAKGHKDANGDYKCDYGCGYEYENPADPKPSDPTENCGCNCHKGGIAGFFFKIIIFFQRIFRTNKTCDCGIAHY